MMHAVPRPTRAADDSSPFSTTLVAERFRSVMEALGLDLHDPNLAATPMRVARAYGELFSGLDPDNEPEMRTFPNTEGYSQVVAVTGIPFHSLCAHHFLPFFGTAHVGYVPKDRVVGLSKLARVVEYCARRPQTQEALTEQVIGLLGQRLDPTGAMVVIEARHFCMEMRGVSMPGVSTTTTAVRGVLMDEGRQRQFLDQLGRTS